MKKSVKRNFTLPQTCDEVWRALTDRDTLAEWMYPNDFEARVDYRLEASGNGTQVHFEQSGFENDTEYAYKGAVYGWAHMHGILTTLLKKES